MSSHTVPKNKWGSIYALFDPRNTKVPKYIGKTFRSLRHRLGEHISQSAWRPEHEKSKWISSLMDSGICPMISLLETCPADDVLSRENHWILFYKPLGSLTNMTGLSEFSERRKQKRTSKSLTIKYRSSKRLWSKNPEQTKKNWKSHPSNVATMERMKEFSKLKSKKVICDNGLIFDSQTQASKFFNIPNSSLRYKMKHGTRVNGVLLKEQ